MRDSGLILKLWRHADWIGLAATLLVTVGGYVLLGQNARVQILDCLDSVIAWAKVLADQKMIFAPAMTPVAPLMNGVARGFVALADLDINTLLYYIFPPFTAFAVSAAIVHATAFWSMLALLRRHVFAPSADTRILSLLIAVAFGLLPFFPWGGLSIAGQPLVLWAYLNARKGKLGMREVLAILLYAFYSSFVDAGIFVIAVATVDVAILCVRRNAGAAWRCATLVAILLIVSVVKERQMIGMMFGSGIVTQRVEIAKFNGLWAVLKETLQVLWRGHHHAWSAQMPLLILVVIAAARALFIQPAPQGPQLLSVTGDNIRDIFWILVAGMLASSLFYGLHVYAGLSALFHTFKLPEFGIHRFQWLQPAMWYVLFALSLGIIGQSRLIATRYRRAVIFGLAGLQVLLCIGHEILGQSVNSYGHRFPYARFYSENLMHDIQTFIRIHYRMEPVQYRIASVGLEPAISQYSGFYTVDGYLVAYPLSYKYAFRKVIAGELARDPRLRDYYDQWGNRVYVFSSELWGKCGQVCTKNRKLPPVFLAIDTRALADLGGRFVLSVTPISNASAIGLKQIGEFDRSDSPWHIVLYEVPAPQSGAGPYPRKSSESGVNG